ncbi:1,2-dihydroxy-3-keto-5-methylthiopentene dioxygenase [Coemansia sp. RSA 2399]|nr:1,2-dihydroxy-3-keto-5-methylthiopentene dioxygenase [Coemansia sp. RSA 2399]KAJ1903800.1 1,2-dihydroxy-3-keto-5-methylthiopentene dioxygenase [Coemansia sp. IMI 209127]
MRAYYYDDSPEDQREAHDSGEPVDAFQLQLIRVQYMRLAGSEEENVAAIDALCKERNYKNRDDITISPTLLPNYEEKIKSFFTEHIHEDEEIRYILDGAGYFDVRDNHRWIRIFVERGDLLIVPAGIYHRFTVDTNNYIKAMRLFKEDPKWTPINHPEADSNKYHLHYLKTIGNCSFC